MCLLGSVKEQFFEREIIAKISLFLGNVNLNVHLIIYAYENIYPNQFSLAVGSPVQYVCVWGAGTADQCESVVRDCQQQRPGA